MRKQPNPYTVRTVVLDSGERLPMLCARTGGLPLFEPTLYALTELRAKNRSTSTIQQALRSVMVLCLVLDRLGVDLDVRLSEGRLLELGEVEEVADHVTMINDGRIVLSAPLKAIKESHRVGERVPSLDEIFIARVGKPVASAAET